MPALTTGNAAASDPMGADQAKLGKHRGTLLKTKVSFN
jgi:hypothetical protein